MSDLIIMYMGIIEATFIGDKVTTTTIMTRLVGFGIVLSISVLIFYILFVKSNKLSNRYLELDFKGCLEKSYQQTLISKYRSMYLLQNICFYIGLLAFIGVMFMIFILGIKALLY